jgi:hypothetical protein
VRETLALASADAGRWLGGREPLERWAEALSAELPAGTRRVHGEEGLDLLAPAGPTAASDG